MNIIVCVDKENGMMFNGRRQSQDRVLREKVMEVCSGSKLWMNGYSAKQFLEYFNILVDEAYLEKAGYGEFCFVEDGILPALERIEQVFLFQWNRRYPADVYFSLNLKEMGFRKVKEEDFQGSSHEKITMEVYELRE